MAECFHAVGFIGWADMTIIQERMCY